MYYVSMKKKTESDSAYSKRSTAYRNWTKEAYDNFRDYQLKYYKQNCRTFSLRYNRFKDGDVVDFLEAEGNVADFVRQAVRKAIKEKEEKESDQK